MQNSSNGEFLMHDSAAAQEDLWLVYDHQCPVCRTYCRYARIRDTVGRLHLVDARQPGELMDEITAAGLDIDQGMVLKFRQVMYYGPDAIHMLSLLSTRSGWFNRLCLVFFGTRWGARVFYPIGKAFRNVLLKLLGISYIENLKSPAARKTR
jgi:predicted DCC family thiol-disulfide oxidoreductase YuxK